jgi:BirA family biotin operon repressor/biotin-[acetyl-CoA-carboxylase] ligase
MTPRERALVELLADGETHSGEAIAAAVGISRTAVWKILHQLDSALGLGIEAVRGQGYRLSAPIELLSPAAIHAELDAMARQRVAVLEILDQVDSTNAYLLDDLNAGAGLGAGEICLAERQSAGRGRLGRRWVSPFGRNIYLSILWRYALAPAQLGGLSLACGVAVVRALQRFGVEGIGLKWPNDVHWQQRKLAGLLLEVAGEAQGPSRVVVGVGINLGLRAADAEAIDQPWVDLTEVCGAHAPSRTALAAALIETLTASLSHYAEAGLAPFLADWRQLDAYRGEPVTLIAGRQRIEGRYRGIDRQGNLRLETAEGQRTFAAGEVSLRAR